MTVSESVPQTARSSDGLNRTDRLMLGWLAVNLVLFGHVVISPSLPLTYVYNVILYLIGASIAYADKTVRKVFAVASIAGVVELLGDYFLVEVAGLVYPYAFPALLRSPLYMPLSWAIVTTQLGYLAVRLAQTYDRRAAIAVPSVLSMILIGFYESFAYHAGIWWYVQAPAAMIGRAPLFIILGEGIMFATLYPWLRHRTVVGGVGFGLTICVSYILAYLGLSALSGL